MEGVTFEAFVGDQKLLDAIVRRLEIIGEASTRISKRFKEDHPLLPWRDMKAMRNKLIHEYDKVNLRAVFSTTKQDVPRLRGQIALILRELSQ
jgi:uncharacterized protein with HEPN domain